MKKLRIYIVSTIPFIIDGITNTLKSKYICISGYSTSPQEAIHSLKEKGYDILLIDDSFLNPYNFHDFLSDLLRAKKNAKTAILTESNDPNYLLNLINIGIRGILSKRSSKENIFELIQALHIGSVYYDSIINSIISHYQSYISSSHFNVLSAKQKEILLLICKGLSNKQISQKLFISIKTVEAHKQNIKVKLGFKTIKEVYALKVSENERYDFNLKN